MLALALSPRLSAQELVVYSMPSPVRYNWKSPHTLFISYLENLLKPIEYQEHKHPMGHMLIELKDSSRHIMAGAIPLDPRQLKRAVLQEKQGLGSLFTRYTGTLETMEENQHQLNDRYPYGDIAYIRILISQPMFERLWGYLEEYKSRGYDTIYNGNNRPREGAGAGCSAFAVSFLEVGRLLDSRILAEWQVNLKIQERLIGRPEKEKRIPIWKMAFTQRWAKEGKHSYQSIYYYEPNAVYKWIKQKNEQPDASLEYTPECRDQAPGIVLDRRHYPIPDEPVWHR